MLMKEMYETVPISSGLDNKIFVTRLKYSIYYVIKKPVIGMTLKCLMQYIVCLSIPLLLCMTCFKHLFHTIDLSVLLFLIITNRLFLHLFLVNVLTKTKVNIILTCSIMGEQHRWSE